MSILRKIIAFTICFCLVSEQTGFAQTGGQIDLSALAPRAAAGPDNFRPCHLRSVGLRSGGDLTALLDPGSAKKSSRPGLNEASQPLLRYFLAGLALPDTTFWVNLRPDSPDTMIDPAMARTDAGRIMLEADLQLKKDTARYTSPDTPTGKEYWKRLYKKAEELYGSARTTIPSLTRPWIVPGEILLRESGGSVYIYKARLNVKLESDHLQNSPTYDFTGIRQKELNEYASGLIRELIIPRLTAEVNSAKKYAGLRQVYYSLILSQWFKKRFRGRAGHYPESIDSGKLEGLVSRESWSPDTYFKAYQQSFKDGEYNVSESVQTVSGPTVRTCVSGGLNLIVAIPDRGTLGEVTVYHAPSGNDFDGGMTPVAVSPGQAATVAIAAPPSVIPPGAVKPSRIDAFISSVWDNREYWIPPLVIGSVVMYPSLLWIAPLTVAVTGTYIAGLEYRRLRKDDPEFARVLRGNPFATTNGWQALARGLDGIFDMPEVIRAPRKVLINLTRILFDLPQGIVLVGMELAVDYINGRRTGEDILKSKFDTARFALAFSSGIHPAKIMYILFHEWNFAKEGVERDFMMYETVFIHTIFSSDLFAPEEDTPENNVFLSSDTGFYGLISRLNLERMDETVQEMKRRNNVLYARSHIKADGLAGGLITAADVLNNYLLNRNRIWQERKGVVSAEGDRPLVRLLTRWRVVESPEFANKPYYAFALLKLLDRYYDSYVTAEELWGSSAYAVARAVERTMPFVPAAIVLARLAEAGVVVQNGEEYFLSEAFKRDLGDFLDENYREITSSERAAIPEHEGVLRVNGKFYRWKGGPAEPRTDGGTKTLAARLRSPDVHVRAAAAKELADHPDPAAVQSARAALADPDEYVRALAVKAVSMIGDRSDIGSLLALLEDGYWFVRSSAVMALGLLADASVSVRIEGLLKDENSVVRGNAARTLGGFKDGNALAALTRLLGDEEMSVRAAGVDALGQIGDPRAITPLIQMFNYGDDVDRELVLKAMPGFRDPRALGLVFDSLNRYSDFIRRIAREILAATPEDDISEFILFRRAAGNAAFLTADQALVLARFRSARQEVDRILREECVRVPYSGDRIYLIIEAMRLSGSGSDAAQVSAAVRGMIRDFRRTAGRFPAVGIEIEVWKDLLRSPYYTPEQAFILSRALGIGLGNDGIIEFALPPTSDYRGQVAMVGLLREMGLVPEGTFPLHISLGLHNTYLNDGERLFDAIRYLVYPLCLLYSPDRRLLGATIGDFNNYLQVVRSVEQTPEGNRKDVENASFRLETRPFSLVTDADAVWTEGVYSGAGGRLRFPGLLRDAQYLGGMLEALSTAPEGGEGIFTPLWSEFRLTLGDFYRRHDLQDLVSQDSPDSQGRLQLIETRRARAYQDELYGIVSRARSRIIDVDDSAARRDGGSYGQVVSAALRDFMATRDPGYAGGKARVFSFVFTPDFCALPDNDKKERFEEELDYFVDHLPVGLNRHELRILQGLDTVSYELCVDAFDGIMSLPPEDYAGRRMDLYFEAVRGENGGAFLRVIAENDGAGKGAVSKAEKLAYIAGSTSARPVFFGLSGEWAVLSRKIVDGINARWKDGHPAGMKEQRADNPGQKSVIALEFPLESLVLTGIKYKAREPSGKADGGMSAFKGRLAVQAEALLTERPDIVTRTVRKLYGRELTPGAHHNVEYLAAGSYKKVYKVSVFVDQPAPLEFVLKIMDATGRAELLRNYDERDSDGRKFFIAPVNSVYAAAQGIQERVNDSEVTTEEMLAPIRPGELHGQELLAAVTGLVKAYFLSAGLSQWPEGQKEALFPVDIAFKNAGFTLSATPVVKVLDMDLARRYTPLKILEACSLALAGVDTKGTGAAVIKGIREAMDGPSASVFFTEAAKELRGLLDRDAVEFRKENLGIQRTGAGYYAFTEHSHLDYGIYDALAGLARLPSRDGKRESIKALLNDFIRDYDAGNNVYSPLSEVFKRRSAALVKAIPVDLSLAYKRTVFANRPDLAVEFPGLTRMELLGPIVEELLYNSWDAIRHAGGKVTLAFALDTENGRDVLRITVTDNGLGTRAPTTAEKRQTGHALGGEGKGLKWTAAILSGTGLMDPFILDRTGPTKAIVTVPLDVLTYKDYDRLLAASTGNPARGDGGMVRRILRENLRALAVGPVGVSGTVVDAKKAWAIFRALDNGKAGALSYEFARQIALVRPAARPEFEGMLARETIDQLSGKTTVDEEADFLIFINGQGAIQGIARFFAPSHGTGALYMLWVAQELQRTGRGIGTMLTDAFFRVSRERDISETVIPSSPGAVGFYRDYLEQKGVAETEYEYDTRVTMYGGVPFFIPRTAIEKIAGSAGHMDGGTVREILIQNLAFIAVGGPGPSGTVIDAKKAWRIFRAGENGKTGALSREFARQVSLVQPASPTESGAEPIQEIIDQLDGTGVMDNDVDFFIFVNARGFVQGKMRMIVSSAGLGTLKTLWVIPELQDSGRGIGTILLDTFFRSLRERNITRAYIPSLAEAAGFYKKYLGQRNVTARDYTIDRRTLVQDGFAFWISRAAIEKIAGPAARMDGGLLDSVKADAPGRELVPVGINDPGAMSTVAREVRRGKVIVLHLSGSPHRDNRDYFLLKQKIQALASAAFLNDRQNRAAVSTLYEGLKNAIMHGNKLDLDLPVAFYVENSGGRTNLIEIYDNAVERPVDEVESRYAQNGGMSGSGRGLDIMQQKYDREVFPLKNGKKVRLSLKNNPTGMFSAIQKWGPAKGNSYPDWKKDGGATGVEIRRLAAGLKDTDVFARARAVKALDEVNDPRTIGPLISAMAGKDAAARNLNEVVAAIVKFGPQAVKPLITALGNKNQDIRYTAAIALGQLPHPGVYEALVGTLENAAERESVRFAAAQSLGRLKDPRAFEPLLKEALHTDDLDGTKNLRYFSIVSLGMLGDPRATDILIGFLDNWAVCGAAVAGLGELKDPRSISALVRFVEENSAYGEQAAAALSGFGAPAVEPLIISLRRKKVWPAVGNLDQYEYAAKALGELGDERAIEPLIGLFGKRHGYRTRDAAINSLKRFGARAVDPLIAALGDANSDIRANVVLALGRIGDARAVDPLLRMFKDTDVLVRSYVIRSLGQLKDERAVVPLVRLLGSVELKEIVSVGAALREITGKPEYERVAGYIAEIYLIASHVGIGRRHVSPRVNALIRAFLQRKIGTHKFIDRLEGVLNQIVVRALAVKLDDPSVESKLKDFLRDDPGRAEALSIMTSVFFSLCDNDDYRATAQRIELVLRKFIEVGDPAAFNRWLYTEADWNKGIYETLLKAGYKPELWTTGISKLLPSGGELIDAREEIRKQTDQLIELARDEDIAFDGRIEALYSYKEAEEFAGEYLRDNAMIDQAELIAILDATKRLEKLYTSGVLAKPEQVRVEIGFDFLKTADAGRNVPGCFNPLTGSERKMPLLHALEANTLFLRVYTSSGNMLANAVLFLTDKGVQVQPLYNAGALNLGKVALEGLAELLKKGWVPAVLLQEQSAGLAAARKYATEQKIASAKQMNAADEGYYTDLGIFGEGVLVFFTGYLLTRDGLKDKGYVPLTEIGRRPPGEVKKENVRREAKVRIGRELYAFCNREGLSHLNLNPVMRAMEAMVAGAQDVAGVVASLGSRDAKRQVTAVERKKIGAKLDDLLAEVRAQADGGSGETHRVASFRDGDSGETLLESVRQDAPGRAMVRVDVNDEDYRLQVSRAAREGTLIVLDLSNCPRKTEEDYRQLKTKLARVGASACTDDPIGSEMAFALYEGLKNAFVHGNKLDFGLPIIFFVDTDGPRMVIGVDVYDTNAKHVMDRDEQRKAESAALFGAGRGLSIIQERHGYDVFVLAHGKKVSISDKRYSVRRIARIMRGGKTGSADGGVDFRLDMAAYPSGKLFLHRNMAFYGDRQEELRGYVLKQLDTFAREFGIRASAGEKVTAIDVIYNNGSGSYKDIFKVNVLLSTGRSLVLCLAVRRPFRAGNDEDSLVRGDPVSFRQEAKNKRDYIRKASALGLRSDAVPALYDNDVFQPDGLCCYLQEWIDGPTVNEVMARRPLTEDELARIARTWMGIARVLGRFVVDAHGENIMMRPDGSLVVVDLGSMRPLEMRERFIIHELFTDYDPWKQPDLLVSLSAAGAEPLPTGAARRAMLSGMRNGIGDKAWDEMLETALVKRTGFLFGDEIEEIEAFRRDGGAMAPGGVDFRQLPASIAGVECKALFGGISPRVAGMDIDAEWTKIQTMVNRGILPSCQRVREYAGACYTKGVLPGRSRELLSCVAAVLRMEETKDMPTEPVFKDLLAVLDGA